MEIKRISKYSQILAISTKDWENSKTRVKDDLKVIQVVIDENFMLYEYIPDSLIEKYYEEQSGTAMKETVAPVKSEAQKELETALDTMLNNDPRQKYTGCNLRVPFDRGDWEWINWCLENMHNEFIRKRIELIKNSGYGA